MQDYALIRQASQHFDQNKLIAFYFYQSRIQENYFNKARGQVNGLKQPYFNLQTVIYNSHSYYLQKKHTMQIELLLQNQMAHSHQYQTLLQKLITQSQNCIQKVSQSATSTEHLQQITKNCNKKIDHFNSYLQLYKKQYIQKGSQICLNQLDQIPLQGKMLGSKENFQKDIALVLQKQKDCIKFYSKSRNVFEDNVNDKLRSLVDGLAFNEL